MPGGGLGEAIRRSFSEKTERGVACDEDFNSEHEIYGYVIRRHRRSAARRVVKSRNEEAYYTRPPGKITSKFHLNSQKKTRFSPFKQGLIEVFELISSRNKPHSGIKYHEAIVLCYATQITRPLISDTTDLHWERQFNQ